MTEKNLILILSVLIMFTGLSCSRTEVETSDSGGGEVPISFSAGVEDTKALFTPENFSRTGHKIAVFDVLDGSRLYMGSIAGNGKGAGVEYECKGDPYWDATNKVTYYWTPTGVHDFFAYSTYYAGADDNDKNAKYPEKCISFSSEPPYSLTISDWELSIDEQFDFLYATHSRSMSEPDPHRLVELQFQHLLSAVGVSFRNVSPVEYTVTDWYFCGISNTGTAVIPFGTGTPVITLSPAQDGPLFEDVDSEGKIQRKKIGRDDGLYYPYRGAGIVGDSEYILVWPHSFDELKDAVFHFVYYPGDQIGEGTAEDLEKQEGKQKIELKMGGDDCDFDVNKWKPGTKYMYNITISDSKIYFDVEIVPWIVDDVILDER